MYKVLIAVINLLFMGDVWDLLFSQYWYSFFNYATVKKKRQKRKKRDKVRIKIWTTWKLSFCCDSACTLMHSRVTLWDCELQRSQYQSAQLQLYKREHMLMGNAVTKVALQLLFQATVEYFSAFSINNICKVLGD